MHHTFIYSTSWEDYDVDKVVMKYNEDDTILTLTSGGCNAIHEASNGAKVYSVDLNKAQNYLLELKIACIKYDYDTLWKAFGLGAECDIEKVGNYMSENAKRFWEKKHYYFNPNKTLYYRGGTGYITSVLSFFNFKFDTLFHQYISIFTFFNKPIVKFLISIGYYTKMYRFISWYCFGVPMKQLDLITNHDKRTLTDYFHCYLRVFNKYKIQENHYYKVYTEGKYSKECCPLYLKEESYELIKKNVNNITILYCSFSAALAQRKYTKVILMDHVDWLEQRQMEILCELLKTQVLPEGKILLRSASLRPRYISLLERSFRMILVNSYETEQVCDAINMYASTWVGVKF